MCLLQLIFFQINYIDKTTNIMKFFFSYFKNELSLFGNTNSSSRAAPIPPPPLQNKKGT